MKSLLKFLFTCVLVAIVSFTFQASEARARVGLNDLSILLPLPNTPAIWRSHYLKAGTRVGESQLLPLEFLEKLDTSEMRNLFRNNPPRLSNPGTPLDELSTQSRLTVTSIRIDPCFKDHFTEACRPQIRLVLQPIEFRLLNGAQLSSVAADTSVHVFYDMRRVDFDHLLNWIRASRLRFVSDLEFMKLPLTVHPIIAAQGVQGHYFQQVLKGIAPFVEFRRLTRIAIFLTGDVANHWLFRTYNVNSMGELEPFRIPGVVPDESQFLENDGSGLVELKTSQKPLPDAIAGSDQMFDFLNDSVLFKAASEAAERIPRLTRSVVRIENPRVHSAGTADCISCHSTPAIRQNLVSSQLYNLSDEASAFKSRTLPPSAMEAIHEKRYTSIDFHMFSYFLATPLVGRRVINETAAIADGLN